MLILVFRQLFIEEAVLLLVQANAAEAIAAAETVLAELALTAIGAVLAVVHHVAVRTVDTLGAPLTSNTYRKTTATRALP